MLEYNLFMYLKWHLWETELTTCSSFTDCVPKCKDDPQGAAYFQDKHICNIFYQCSNGDIILQNCSNETSWSHSKCTCDHFDDEMCDRKTYKFFQPAMSFAKCTKRTWVLHWFRKKVWIILFLSELLMENVIRRLKLYVFILDKTYVTFCVYYQSQ